MTVNHQITQAIDKLDEVRTLLEDALPEKEPEVASQTIRFTAREKAALQRLARAQRRSEHFILKDILSPALLAAAEKLETTDA